MRFNGLDQGQRAALRRLRRAQLAEARRIRHVVAASYLLTPAHLRSSCRIAARAEARQVAMYLMRARALAAADAQRGVLRHADRTVARRPGPLDRDARRRGDHRAPG